MNSQQERKVQATEEKSIAATAKLREISAQLEQQIQENRRLQEEVERMQQKELELKEQTCKEVQNAKEQSERATDRARRELQRTRQENERLSHRVSMAETACHEAEQQLNVYLGVPVIAANELRTEETELGTGSFAGKSSHFSIVRCT